ncbi:MAG: hypothetical protein WBA89_03610 [Microcoleus sp.]
MTDITAEEGVTPIRGEREGEESEGDWGIATNLHVRPSTREIL